MALGRAERQGSFDDAGLLLGDQLAEGSIYRLLAGHGDALFGDGYFAGVHAFAVGAADGAGADDRDGDVAAGAGGAFGSGGV